MAGTMYKNNGWNNKMRTRSPTHGSTLYIFDFLEQLMGGSRIKKWQRETSGQRINPLTPESVRNVFGESRDAGRRFADRQRTDVLQPLVGSAFVQRTALRAVGADLHVVEGLPDLRLHIFPAGIKG